MNLEDVGGHQFEYDLFHGSIAHARMERMADLQGNYVITATGKSSGNLTFLQDQSVSSGGYWTKYLSNARKFNSIASAKSVVRNFKYGNPRVALVTNKNECKFIK